MVHSYCASLPTTLGELLLVGDGRTLTAIRFASEEGALLPEGALRRQNAEPFPETVRQLEAYFERRLREFDLPLAPAGTPFQRAVWDELLRIPYGATITYGELARRMGRPRAMRAVGAANGANPIPIVIPCHRVIGAGGQLTGYGGGLHLKRRLLVLEGALP